MPRPKEFDPDLALDDAMKLFWERGYAATSMQDLVDRMGINRFSIYETFGNKRELFLRALERYREQIGGGALAGLTTSEEGLSAIKRYFDALVDYLDSPDGRKACLMVNSITEKATDDQDIRTACMKNVTTLERAMRMAVERAMARGEISRERDAQAMAEYLATNAIGLNVIAKADRRRERLQRSVDLLMDTLN